MPFDLQLLARIADVEEGAWDRLRDEQANPFVRWAWLAALEGSGCAASEAGWIPRHLTLWRREGEVRRLVAAAPAYLRSSSDGDFSRDFGLADAAYRAGLPYYPKLLLGVPFTPVTGRRLLVAADEPRGPAVRRLAAAAVEVAREAGAHLVQVLFPVAEEVEELAAAGFSRRLDFQFHWQNPGYATVADYLGRFDAKHRHNQRRERAAPGAQGITLRTIRGAELAAAPMRFADLAHDLHSSTVDKLRWGRRWLNRAFYRRAFSTMPGDLELVVAERGAEVVAGAFNVATSSHLWGRYWGCFEEHRFLHFNVCLYHSIDECIALGRRRLEGGAGGEHKIPRGFEPALTYSSYRFLDRRLEGPFTAYLARESGEREAALDHFQARSPIWKR